MTVFRNTRQRRRYPNLSPCTMGSQPDLARHQGSRRLIANGVKCMSNYSELSTYHEYGNIFPMSCTLVQFFTLHKSQKSELWNNHWKKLAAREKCRLIDVQNSNHRYFEMLLGVHTCWLEPLVPLLKYQRFLIFVSHVSCHFSWIIPKRSLYFFIGNVR